MDEIEKQKMRKKQEWQGQQNLKEKQRKMKRKES
jgi:hypothetical protein